MLVPQQPWPLAHGLPAQIQPVKSSSLALSVWTAQDPLEWLGQQQLGVMFKDFGNRGESWGVRSPLEAAMCSPTCFLAVAQAACLPLVWLASPGPLPALPETLGIVPSSFNKTLCCFTNPDWCISFFLSFFFFLAEISGNILKCEISQVVRVKWKLAWCLLRNENSEAIWLEWEVKLQWSLT